MQGRLAEQADSIAELWERSVEVAAELGSLSWRGENNNDKTSDDEHDPQDEMAEIKAGCARAEAVRVDTERRLLDLEMDRNRTTDDDDGTPGRASARHRKQSGGCACDAGAWPARTAAVVDACCPATAGSGHRRTQDVTCPLSASCPSASCAAAFVPYYEDCVAELQGHAADIPLAQFRSFYASCQEVQVGSQLMLQDAQPAMIFPRARGGRGQRAGRLHVPCWRHESTARSAPTAGSGSSAAGSSHTCALADRRIDCTGVPARLYPNQPCDLRPGLRRDDLRLPALHRDRRPRHGNDLQQSGWHV